MAHVIVCVCQAGNLVVDFIRSDKIYMPIFHRIVNVLGPVPGMYGPSGDEEYCGDSPDAFDCQGLWPFEVVSRSVYWRSCPFASSLLSLFCRRI